ncbi:MAG TPA: hypothetical protein DIC28_05650 [Aerococcus urinaeequi]|nr:hypothetical protein [Aerococcus urinaeequi]
MDWNNINNDRDTSGLGPIEYDQSKVPALIRKHANNVRTKTYGQEVREAQARNAELAGLIANEADTKATNADILSKDTQNRFKDQIEGTTNSDEVIDARRAFGGDATYQTLGDRLNDSSISPDYFVGNDLQKIQKAIEFAKSRNGGTIRFSRIYDITGLGSLYLDKINADDRRVIIFKGDGGGIRKDDAGFIFDGNVNNSSDWFFENMEFYSTRGAGTTILNADRIIRAQFTNIHARNVDCIATATERFMQTISFFGGSIIGGDGWAFSAPCYYDFILGGGLMVEHRENFFEQTIGTVGTWQALNNVRFTDILIEGLRGKAIKVIRTENLKIDGVYLENNKGGHIDFSEADYLDGVSISNCRISEPTNTLLTSAIAWGGRLRGVSTRNNFVRNIPLHDTTAVIASVNYIVYSYQDVAMDSARNSISNIDSKKQVERIGMDERQTVGDTNIMSSYLTKRLQSSATRTLIAKQYGEFKVTFSEGIYRDSIISVQTQHVNVPQQVIVAKTYVNTSDNSVRVWVLNNSEINLDITLYVTVLKVGQSIIG